VEKKELRRGLIAPLLVSILGFGVFLRTPGAENVRAVQVVMLVACGMGLGVALTHLRILFGMGSQK
jgi:hypothetical protein